MKEGNSRTKFDDVIILGDTLICAGIFVSDVKIICQHSSMHENEIKKKELPKMISPEGIDSHKLWNPINQ